MHVKRRCVSLSEASRQMAQICKILTAHARALSTRNALKGRAHISAHIATDAASVHHFQVVRCQATLTRVGVTWMSLELPMRDHELEVFCEYGNKLSAQGNNTCSMEFAKHRRRCIVALCLVCIILEAHQETCLKRKCIIPERLCHYRSSWRSQRRECFDHSI